MSKRFFPLGAILFILVLNPIIAIADSFIEPVPDSSNAIFSESESGVVISMEDYFSGDSQGGPALPVKDIKLLVPNDTI